MNVYMNTIVRRLVISLKTFLCLKVLNSNVVPRLNIVCHVTLNVQ